MYVHDTICGKNETNHQYMYVFWLHACVLGHLQNNNDTHFRVVANLGEKECGVGSDASKTFYILCIFFKKESHLMQIWQNGTICLTSVVNPWVYVMYYFLLFL